MKLRLYILLTLLVGTTTAWAQDIHFSQFYASPLTLNPALTGNFNGFYRVTGIYRNQYPGLSNNKPVFSTPSVSLDFSLLREKLKNRGALGVGLVFFNDQQNGKTFNQNQILASVAYNMNLAKNGAFQLGVGLQGGIVMMNVNADKLEFGDGYNSNLEYDNTLTQENYASGKKVKGAFNVGLFVKSEFHKGMRFYTGYAFNNASNYKQDFWKGSTPTTYKLPFRHTLHGGFEFDIKDKAVLIPATYLCIRQRPTRLTLV
jgi:type IX secretion system PorP/SprF family membrane protein